MEADLNKKYLDYPGYEEEGEDTFNIFIKSLGALVKSHFQKSEYLKVKGVDLGWQKLTATRAIKVHHGYSDELVGRTIYTRCCLEYDNHVRVYRKTKSSKGLVIIATNHDNPVNGNHFFLTPCTERTYNKLR